MTLLKSNLVTTNICLIFKRFYKFDASMKNRYLFLICCLASIAFNCCVAQTSTTFKAANDTILVKRLDTPQTCNILVNDVFTMKNKPTSLTIVTQPKGSAEVELGKGMPKIIYTASYEGNQPDRLVYKICSATKQCDTASVVIYKCPAPNVAFPKVEEKVIELNTTLDFEFPTQIIRLSRGKEPKNGQFNRTNEASKATYIPNENFTGVEQLVFGVYEDRDMCGTTHIESYSYLIAIVPNEATNKAPVAVTDEITIKGSAKTHIDVMANDYDPENTLQPKIFDVVDDPKYGKIKRTPKKIYYTAKSKFKGNDSFTYKICDYNDACTLGTVNITVK